jgi:LPP20 lipoprotein
LSKPILLSSFLFVIIGAAVTCHAQVYPRWFLEPVSLSGTAAGYAQNFFRQTSTDSAAFLKACENLTRQHYTEFHGGEAYWETEAGVYWMGNNFTEKIDSGFLKEVVSNGKRLVKYSTRDMTLMLISEKGLTVPESMCSMVKCSEKQPDWVEAAPQGGGYVYAEGVAPQYFYESSSWEAAEKRARFNLARNIRVTIETMQKDENQSGEEIRNEEVSETLHGTEVVHRWRDVSRGLYYVLIRMPGK